MSVSHWLYGATVAVGVFTGMGTAAADPAPPPEPNLTPPGVQHSNDKLSEMSETSSIKLQQAMERSTKLQSQLANIMKKASPTAQNIADNMK